MMTTMIASLFSILLSGNPASPSPATVETVRAHATPRAAVIDRAPRGEVVSESSPASATRARSLGELMRARLVDVVGDGPTEGRAVSVAALHAAHPVDVVSDVP